MVQTDIPDCLFQFSLQGQSELCTERLLTLSGCTCTISSRYLVRICSGPVFSGRPRTRYASDSVKVIPPVYPDLSRFPKTRSCNIDSSTAIDFCFLNNSVKEPRSDSQSPHCCSCTDENPKHQYADVQIISHSFYSPNWISYRACPPETFMICL